MNYEEMIKDISGLKTEVNNIKDKVSGMENRERNDTVEIVKLSTVIQEIVNSNKNVVRTLNNLSDAYIENKTVMKEVTESLNNLNHEVKSTNKEVYSLKEQVNNIKFNNDSLCNNKIEITKGKFALYTTIIVTFAGIVTTIINVFSS